MKRTGWFGLILLVAVAPGIAGCVAAAGAGAAAGATAAHDRRSTGAFVDDQIIEVKALKLFAEDPGLNEQAHLNVISVNNVVLLTGEVPSETLRERAAALARGINKVRRVHNEIAIAAPSSLLSRSSDTVITGKVKVALLGDDESSALRIKVATERGIVYLLGVVTRGEGDGAAEVARRVGGVQRVVKLFEYVD